MKSYRPPSPAPRPQRPSAQALEPRRLLAATFAGDLDAAPAGSFPSHFAPYGGGLYFFASDHAGRELWVTNGTAAGTRRLLDSRARRRRTEPPLLPPLPRPPRLWRQPLLRRHRRAYRR